MFSGIFAVSFKQSKLLEVLGNGEVRSLERVSARKTPDGIQYDEAHIENLLFEHPEILPISEIDSAYTKPVSVCTQLSTRVGPLDILYITRSGRIVILEAKLWRNPEAKRKVIAQILDYASELTRWSYEDLEREVSRRRGAGKQSLFHLVCGDGNEEQEAQFVDAVTRSLHMGRFLLLICGDGIREGLGGIAEFLENHTTLDFTFGLIEMAIYGAADGRYVVYPRVLANSVTLRRQVIRVEGGSVSVADELEADEDEPQEVNEQRTILFGFWTDFAARVQFDDASQMPPNPVKRGHASLKMPSPRAWITLYFVQSKGEQGLELSFNKGTAGDIFYQRLCEERDQINQELPAETEWWSDGEKHKVTLRHKAPDITTEQGKQDALDWFQTYANQFVNAFRPRIALYIEDL